jgi:hypothetical protein
VVLGTSIDIMTVPFALEPLTMAASTDRRKEIVRDEIDVRMNPRFVERQRNRYAARGVALIILMNAIAAIAILIGLAHGAGQNLKDFADAMMIFGVGAAAGLASMFFAYLRRLLRIENTMPLPWLAIAAAVLGAVCFVWGLGVARNAVSSEKAATPPAAITPPAATSPDTTTPPAAITPPAATSPDTTPP